MLLVTRINGMKKEEIKVCRHCVMNTTDANLVLDENGVCDRCRDYEERVLPWWNHGEGHEEELKKLIADIKKSGEGKEYDCLLDSVVDWIVVICCI